MRAYRNFRNPIGLVTRMLSSRDRAARSALLRAGVRVAATPLDLALGYRERKTIAAADGEVTHPIILVVGGSRSGTTLLHQVLAASLRVSYFTNWSSIFPRAPITANRRVVNRTRPDGFSNYYGQTGGWLGPNDGFFVWNRWLGSDRYAATPELDRSEVDDMRRFFAAWTAQFPMPFLNKNNRNAGAIGLLAEALPSAKFVAVYREPESVARSLIRARAVVHGDTRLGWGVGATDKTETDDALAYVGDVAEQVWSTESRLRSDLSLLGAERTLSVEYEELCFRAPEVVDRIAAWAPAEVVRRRLPVFQPSTGPSLSPEEEARLITELEARYGSAG